MMSIVVPALRCWMIPLRVAGGSAAERSGGVLPIGQNTDTLIHLRPIAMSRDRKFTKAATNMERREGLKTMAIAGLAASAGGATANAQRTARAGVIVHRARHRSRGAAPAPSRAGPRRD